MIDGRWPGFDEGGVDVVSIDREAKNDVGRWVFWVFVLSWMSLVVACGSTRPDGTNSDRATDTEPDEWTNEDA